MSRSHLYQYNLGIWFQEITRIHPDHKAIVYNLADQYTYTDLNTRANEFAYFLEEKGLGKGHVVAILNNKSFMGLALMIACLKSGVIYANIDHTSPPERIAKILDRCRPSLVFNDHSNHEKFGLPPDIEVINLQDADIEKILSLQPKENPPFVNNVNGSDPAYIMFTSGSTGFPKGATMSHRNVMNFIEWGRETFKITPEDVFTNVNPIYFDNSVFDFYTALFTGAALMPITSDELKDARKMLAKIDNLKCTIWFSVPSMLVYLLTTKTLGKNSFRTIKKVVFGGEGFPKSKLKELYELFSDRIQLVNVYGPTECTCICSSYPISEKDFEVMDELAPLGYIAPNFGFEILPVNEDDMHMGELCLKGPNVGLGYYRDEERTQQSFVRNPFNERYNETIYKTGDLVELRKDGYLYFKGRVDNQIKHMGYRIELEEIEAALNKIPFVKEAGVIYKHLGNGLGQILAFIGVDGEHEPDEVEVLYKKQLPPYMWPKKVVLLSSLPKNSNGKIDRQQLKNIGS